jgi:hypothetical protein
VGNYVSEGGDYVTDNPSNLGNYVAADTLRWNSSAAITKCSLTMWRGETVYAVIGASKSTTPAGQRSDWDFKALPDKSETDRSRC